jgi:hypothetical protein
MLLCHMNFAAKIVESNGRHLGFCRLSMLGGTWGYTNG